MAARARYRCLLADVVVVAQLASTYLPFMHMVFEMRAVSVTGASP
ncbi:MAG: hypothetical protein WDZ83_09850 [Rhizobiaceae bacterium]